MVRGPGDMEGAGPHRSRTDTSGSNLAINQGRAAADFVKGRNSEEKYPTGPRYLLCEGGFIAMIF